MEPPGIQMLKNIGKPELYCQVDCRQCANYQGITLLGVTSKTYKFILDRRLRTIADKDMAETQSRRNTQDCIFILKQSPEKSKFERVYKEETLSRF